MPLGALHRAGLFGSIAAVTEPKSYKQHAYSLPPDATEILMIRHGASAPAVDGVLFPLKDGHGDPPLAPEGEEQAQRVAERLAGEPLAALFVTTLQRTHQTAAPLAARQGLEPIVVPELREVHLGEWEGGVYRKKLAEGDPLGLQVLSQERWDLIPGAEASEDFAARTRAGIEKIVAAVGPGRRAAAVLHGGVIGELCHQATSSRPFAFVHGENGGISRLLVFTNGTWLLRSFNDSSHLG